MFNYAVLFSIFFKGPDDPPPHYDIAVNIDGAKFGLKAVMTSLWPIQIHVWGIAPAGFDETKLQKLEGGNPTHIVGVHHASHKPENYRTFLRKFTDELIYLDPNNNDAETENRSVTVRMVVCICDTIARNSVKDIYSHASKFPCEKCFSVGLKIGKNHTSSWVGNNALRTDENFLTSKYHARPAMNDVNGKMEMTQCPFRELPYFGMVTGFPLDPMHTVYLCALKSWLQKLTDGKKGTENPLPTAVTRKLEKKLTFFKNFTPVEFRSARLKSFNHLSKWKAAEMRLFILYNAVPLFRGVVEEKIFVRLCYIVVALFCIGGTSAKPVPEKHLKFAQKLIEKFVSEIARDNFGTGLKPTIHFMLHIVNDCRYHKCHLDRLGAWVYENGMRHTLNSVHSGNRALEQIFNREDERLAFTLPLNGPGRILDTTPIGAAKYYPTKEEEHVKPFLQPNAWKRHALVFPKSCGNFTLKPTKKNRDCHFIYQYGTDRTEFQVAKYLHSYDRDDGTGDIVVVGQLYRRVEPLFQKPCNSTLFYALKFWDLNPESQTFEASDIKGKIYAVPSVDEIELGHHDDVTDSDLIMKSQLVAYLNSSLPNTARNAPVQPKFDEVAKLHFDAWEGIGLRHIFDGSGAATLY